MYRVAVVMSTYNGLKYIDEQIKSIFAQKDVKIDLYIRDDGSTDRSFLEYLCQFQNRSDIIIDYGPNRGVGISFFECLKSVPANYDYYAFADQDDVWLNNKIIKAIQAINSVEGKVLYASNQVVVDEFLENDHMRFNKTPGINVGEIIRGNQISGCTFVFNQELFRFIIDDANQPRADLLRVRIHDVWVATIAALFGTIVYDYNGYILYRQHENNVVGVKEYGLIHKATEYYGYVVRPQRGAAVLCNELIRVFGKRLDNYWNPIYCLSQYHNSIISHFRLVRFYWFYKHENESLIAFSIKVFLNVI